MERDFGTMSDMYQKHAAGVVASEEFLQQSSFSSIKLQLHIQNTTTKTFVKSDNPAQLVEILDCQLVLEIPRNSCSKGHSLLIQLSCTLPDKKEFDFSFTARVEEVDANIDYDSRDKILITLVQFEELHWKKLCDTLNNRQHEIEQFLKAARGY